jgi:hypothetical protein
MSLDDSFYGVGAPCLSYGVTSAALAAVYRRGAEFAETRSEWSDGEWARRLYDAAKLLDVDSKEAARSAATEIARFMLTAPPGPISREAAVASFRFVADGL